MIKKFKSFLESEFKSIAPSKEAMEYREEVLGNLMDKSQEYRLKGLTDEDVIFKLCLESLGDFQSTLRDFETKRTQLALGAKKVGSKVFALGGAFLAVLLCYLLVSFLVPDVWGKSWLILVGGCFGIVCTLSVFVIQKLAKKRKYFLLRLPILLINTLVFVFIYLMLLMLSSWNQSWLMFIFMALSLTGVDTLVAFLLNSKLKYLELCLFIPLLFSLLYVVCGITGLLPWHPTWLMILFGVLVDAGVIAGLLAVKSRKKKETEKQKQTESVDYYTKWSDE